MTRTIKSPEITVPSIPPALRVSPEAFEELCSENPELRLERTAKGELEAMSPASGGTGRRNAWITIRLGMWVEATGRGIVFDSSAGFTLPSGAVRSPDASWIEAGRWEALTERDREEGFPPICPDFVVELRSPSDSPERLHEKMREYIREGALLGWLIDPSTKSVTVYRRGRTAETLSAPLSLSGEDVLPGFVLDLKGILFD